MLRFIENLPPYVVGIHAVGEVNKHDYEKVLIPRIKELADRQGEINYLLVLETDVQNFSIASWWEDFKLGLKNFTKWNKIAVVTDQKSVEWFSNVFRYFIPGKSKGFPPNQLDAAIKWISEKDDDKDHKTEAQTKIIPSTSNSDNDVLESNEVNSSNKGQGLVPGENL